jgi:hypothetical protein
VDLLRSIRSSLGLPRNCVVVLWDAGDAGALDSPLRPLTEAGFRVLGVSTPTEALAALARVTPRPHGGPATAWLALNTNGGAVVVVREGAVIYARTFAWTISAPAERRQAHLLRRYLRVAQVVPELRRAVQTVRATDGVVVRVAITCGNLPDLRSLTMPLIAETDIEVETLDSMVGLESGGRTSELQEQAAAVRLAAAAAVTTPAGGRTSGVMRFAAAAVLTVVVAAAIWWTYGLWGTSRAASPAAPSEGGASAVGMRSAQGDIPDAASSRGTAPVQPPVEPLVPESVSSAQPDEARAGTERREAAATSGRMPSQAGAGGRAHRESGAGAASHAAPKARLPSVDGILISPQLRLAVLDGVIVGVGDVVGSLRVSRIDQDAVVLQDSSGQEIRLPVRPKTRGL